MKFALACAFAVAAGCDRPALPGDRAPDLAIPVEDLAPTCTATSCGGPAPFCHAPSGRCVACRTDDDCASGKLCVDQTCLPGCSPAHACPDGGGACDPASHRCAPCSSDGDCNGENPRCDRESGLCVPCLPLNDNCPGGHFCEFVNGSYLCDPGCLNSNACSSLDGGAFTVKCCSGFCVATDRDVGNCGGCGMVCAGGHAQWQCAASACVVAGCDPGFADCDHAPGNGCEADLTSDGKNCGACGVVCGHCAASQCGG